MGDVLTLGTMIRLVLSFAAVIGGLMALRWWTQRGPTRSSNGIRVVSRAGIARGASVAVIEVVDRVYLVGITEHGVNLIGELDTEVADALGPPPKAPLGEPAGSGGPTGGPGNETLAFAGISFEDFRTQTAANGWRSGPWTGLMNRLRRMTVRSSGPRPARDIA